MRGIIMILIGILAGNISCVVDCLCLYRLFPLSFTQGIITFDRRTTIAVSKSQIKNVFFDLFNNSLDLWRFIFNNKLILFDLRNQMRILLQFLSKSNSLLNVKNPFLSSFFVFTSINFFIRLLNSEIKELFLHVECHIFLLDDLQPIQITQRSNFFRLFREIACVLVSYHTTLERINEKIPIFEIHERTFSFHDYSSNNCSERKRQISLHILMISLFFVLILAQQGETLFILTNVHSCLSMIVLYMNVDILVK